MVHNDLNHSNIIIEKNNAKFIDIEDICYDYLQQAIAHLFFKVTRHSIYNRKISIYNLKKNYLPKIMAGLLTLDNSGLAAISLANYFKAE